MGLGYIAAVLRLRGHEVQVLDINACRWSQEEVEDRIASSDADLFGITGMITVYRKIKPLTFLIKKHHPDKVVVLGGGAVSSAPDLLLQHAAADIGVLGEGEVTTCELVETLQRGGDLDQVLGIIYRTPSGEIRRTPCRPVIQNLDEIPFPAWDLFPMEIYLANPVGVVNVHKWVNGGTSSDRNYVTMNLNSSRGCPYNCRFCYHDFMGKRFRERSPENIVEEMQLLKERYGVDFLLFSDDMFLVRKESVLRLCDLILEGGLNLLWEVSWRVNMADEPVYKRMKEAGCIMVGYGVESGSQKILDRMNKQVKVEKVESALRLTKRIFGANYSSLIIGFPGETRETIRETIDFCGRVEMNPEVIFYATPYPGTALWEMAINLGKIMDVEQYVLNLGEQGERIAVNFTDWTDDELRSLKEQMVQELRAQNLLVHDLERR